LDGHGRSGSPNVLAGLFLNPRVNCRVECVSFLGCELPGFRGWSGSSASVVGSIGCGRRSGSLFARERSDPTPAWMIGFPGDRDVRSRGKVAQISVPDRPDTRVAPFSASASRALSRVICRRVGPGEVAVGWDRADGDDEEVSMPPANLCGRGRGNGRHEFLGRGEARPRGGGVGAFIGRGPKWQTARIERIQSNCE
jgi:hypothetical protein